LRNNKQNRQLKALNKNKQRQQFLKLFLAPPAIFLIANIGKASSHFLSHMQRKDFPKKKEGM
jgi:hypothetical protein